MMIIDLRKLDKAHVPLISYIKINLKKCKKQNMKKKIIKRSKFPDHGTHY